MIANQLQGRAAADAGISASTSARPKRQAAKEAEAHFKTPHANAVVSEDFDDNMHRAPSVRTSRRPHNESTTMKAPSHNDGEDKAKSLSANGGRPSKSTTPSLNLDYVDREISRLEAAMPGATQPFLEHAPPALKRTMLPYPSMVILERYKPKGGILWRGALFKWLRSSSVLPIISMWFKACVDDERLREELQEFLPQKLYPWTEQLKIIADLAKLPDSGRSQFKSDTKIQLVCAIYARKLFLCNQTYLIENGLGTDKFIWYEALNIPCAILLAAYRDVTQVKDGFFSILLHSPLVQPMQPALRARWEEKYTFKSSDFSPQHPTRFYTPDAMPQPSGRPAPKGAVDWKADYDAEPFSTAEQLAFFLACREWMKTSPTLGVSPGHISQLLPGRCRDECGRFYYLIRHKLMHNAENRVIVESSDGGPRPDSNVLRVTGPDEVEPSKKRKRPDDTLIQDDKVEIIDDEQDDGDQEEDEPNRLTDNETDLRCGTDKPRVNPTTADAIALFKSVGDAAMLQKLQPQTDDSIPNAEPRVPAGDSITTAPSSSTTGVGIENRVPAAVTGAAALPLYVPPPPLPPQGYNRATGEFDLVRNSAPAQSAAGDVDARLQKEIRLKQQARRLKFEAEQKHHKVVLERNQVKEERDTMRDERDAAFEARDEAKWGRAKKRQALWLKEKEVKELQEEMDSVKAENAALKANRKELEELRAKMAALEAGQRESFPVAAPAVSTRPAEGAGEPEN